MMVVVLNLPVLPVVDLQVVVLPKRELAIFLWLLHSGRGDMGVLKNGE